MIPWIFQRGGLAGLLCAAMSFVTSTSAQDIDTVVYAGNPGRTILDQIEGVSERQALQELLAKKAAAERLARAQAFLENYPQSWLLAQVYEIASKAAIDLDQFELAERYGDDSLRFLPENPALLVPLANLAAHRGRMGRAEALARSAIAQLQRFGRPVGFSKQDWQRTAQELEASSRYVLGQALATRGFSQKEPEKKKWMEPARAMLERSRALNRDDPLSAYLLGLVLLELGANDRAAVEFAAALSVTGEIQARAREELRKLHSSSGAAGSFENYAASLAAKSRETDYGLPDSGPPRSRRSASYAGSESCRLCHGEVYESWSRTGMARMFRPYAAEAAIGDFQSVNVFKDEPSGVEVRISSEGDRRYLSFLNEQGDWTRFPVDYTIGSKWQQAYATRLPNGRIHVFPIQYSRVENRWLNFWKIIDGGMSKRSDIAAFPKLTAATSYQLHCAPCHTSQTQSETGRVEPAEINFHEPGVNCEMCHGPSADHASILKNGGRETPGAATPVRFDQIDSWRSVQICAQCHMQSRMVEAGKQGEINYSGAADPFFQEVRSRPYNEFSLQAIYKDGRFRETTFITESFLRSACFQRGGATCVHCHDPHPPNPEANPKSLKFLDDPDRMCLGCHRSIESDIASHTRHAANTEASRCASCHMPKIMRSMLFQAATHRIDDIPSAEMTARFGLDESPNACLGCHTAESVDWLREQLAGWSGAEARSGARLPNEL